jgi:hypothetical protein
MGVNVRHAKLASGRQPQAVRCVRPANLESTKVLPLRRRRALASLVLSKPRAPWAAPLKLTVSAKLGSLGPMARPARAALEVNGSLQLAELAAPTAVSENTSMQKPRARTPAKTALPTHQLWALEVARPPFACVTLDTAVKWWGLTVFSRANVRAAYEESTALAKIHHASRVRWENTASQLKRRSRQTLALRVHQTARAARAARVWKAASVVSSFQQLTNLIAAAVWGVV